MIGARFTHINVFFFIVGISLWLLSVNFAINSVITIQLLLISDISFVILKSTWRPTTKIVVVACPTGSICIYVVIAFATVLHFHTQNCLWHSALHFELLNWSSWWLTDMRWCLLGRIVNLRCRRHLEAFAVDATAVINFLVHKLLKLSQTDIFLIGICVCLS